MNANTNTTYKTSQKVLKQLLKDYGVRSSEYNTSVGGHLGLMVNATSKVSMEMILHILVQEGFETSVDVKQINKTIIIKINTHDVIPQGQPE